MTYIEALAEKIGVKEAARAALAGCPGNHFVGAAKLSRICCNETTCGLCWTAEMPEGEEE